MSIHIFILHYLHIRFHITLVHFHITLIHLYITLIVINSVAITLYYLFPILKDSK